MSARNNGTIHTVDAVFCADDLLQRVVSLRADLHRLGEGGSASGQEHELLERKLVAGVGSTVDDVEGGDGEHVRRLDAGEVREVLVEGDALLGGGSLSNRDRDTEDGVSTELALVGGAIELDQEVVNLLLLGDLELGLDQLWANNVVDVGDGLRDT